MLQSAVHGLKKKGFPITMDFLANFYINDIGFSARAMIESFVANGITMGKLHDSQNLGKNKMD